MESMEGVEGVLVVERMERMKRMESFICYSVKKNYALFHTVKPYIITIITSISSVTSVPSVFKRITSDCFSANNHRTSCCRMNNQETDKNIVTKFLFKIVV